MTNLKNIKDMTDNFNPFEFACSSCGKTKVYTEEKIEKDKKPHPKPETYMFDFFIPCPFCKKGLMEPPSFVSFSGAFEDLNEK